MATGGSSWLQACLAGGRGFTNWMCVMWDCPPDRAAYSRATTAAHQCVRALCPSADQSDNNVGRCQVAGRRMGRGQGYSQTSPAQALRQGEPVGPEWNAIDEISVRKGHKYPTLVLDLRSGKVVFVGDILVVLFAQESPHGESLYS